jgi:hypothetical protein
MCVYENCVHMSMCVRVKIVLCECVCHTQHKSSTLSRDRSKTFNICFFNLHTTISYLLLFFYINHKSGCNIFHKFGSFCNKILILYYFYCGVIQKLLHIIMQVTPYSETGQDSHKLFFCLSILTSILL